MVSAEPGTHTSNDGIAPDTGLESAQVFVKGSKPVGFTLMQTKDNMVSAEPATNIHNNGTAPGTGLLQSAQVLVKASKPVGFISLASRPHLSKGGFCTSHPCSMLAAGAKGRGLGATADMDEAGYEAVTKLKDDEEMKTFILRFIKSYDCRVDEEGGLMGMVPWFSGTTAVQSFSKLEESLLFAVLAHGDRWISYKNSAGTTGKDAPLDLQGYMEIAIIRKDIEMQAFARRLCEKMGIQITDEGGFAGMIKYHSGAADFQSFDKLQEEIRSAAVAPHAWAKLTSPKFR